MVGRTISQYRIVAKLGEGGMGVAYEAEDTQLGRTVALKFLAVQLMNDEETTVRFLRQAKAAAALSHPEMQAASISSPELSYPLLTTYASDVRIAGRQQDTSREWTRRMMALGC